MLTCTVVGAAFPRASPRVEGTLLVGGANRGAWFLNDDVP